MTYFGFLVRFVLIPIVVIGGLLWFSSRRGRKHPPQLSGLPVGRALLAHVIVAMLYTTPWDNYLVATGVWWYDPNLVTGIVIGWVPIEEYTFFVVQTIMSGLWLVLLARYLPLGDGKGWRNNRLRVWATAVVGLIWLGAVLSPLVWGRSANYLMLELGWALPAIMFQLAFGADILWRYRWLVLLGIVPTTLYLSYGDSLAIGSGTWTIDPAQSLNIYIGGVLPVEEFIFFLLTNTLVIFGMTLVLAQESQERLHGEVLPWLAQRVGRERASSL